MHFLFIPCVFMQCRDVSPVKKANFNFSHNFKLCLQLQNNAICMLYAFKGVILKPPSPEFNIITKETLPSGKNEK